MTTIINKGEAKVVPDNYAGTDRSDTTLELADGEIIQRYRGWFGRLRRRILLDPTTYYDEYSLALDFKQSRYRTPLGYSTDLMAIGGPELVTNGGFADLSGWTAINSASLAIVNGELEITGNGTANAPGARMSVGGLVVGRKYQATVTARRGTALQARLASGAEAHTTSSTSNASLSITFTASVTSHFIDLLIPVNLATGTAYFDNLSVHEVAASYTRSGVKAELAASTGLVSFAANKPGIVPDVGYWSRGAVTNKCTNYNANPSASLTNMTTFVGGTLTRELRPDLIEAAGLQAICTSGYVYKLVLAGGQESGVNITGAVGNLNPHSAGIWAMVENAPADGLGVQLCYSGSNNLFKVMKAPGESADTGLVYYSGTQTPGLAGDGLRIRKPSSTSNTITVYFILNQLVEGTQPRPIIVTTGAAATVGADDMRLASPITADEDFIVWVSLNFKTAPDASDRPVGFSDGTANNRFIFERNITTGALQGAYAAGGGPFTVMFAPSISQTTAGRASILIRRRAGKWTVAAKNSTGAANISAEEPVTTFPTGLNRMDVGHFLSGQQPRSPIEFVGIRRGTFTNAECLEILEQA